MQDLNSVIFIEHFPKLDLHGYDRESARVAIEDFIEENKKLKNNIIVIVHGIGSGVIKQTTHLVLSKNKSVLDFKTFYYNDGVTIANIKM